MGKDKEKELNTPIIDWVKVVMELSDDSFAVFRSKLADYVDYYFVKPERADRLLVLEKWGEFLKNYEKNERLRDKQIANKYSSLLVTLLKQQERDDRFLARAEYISEQLKDCDNEAAIQYLEDLTKIFICSYGTKNVLFNVTAADGEAVCRHILEDKVEVNTIVKDGWNRIVPAKIRNNGEKAMDNAGKLADGMKDAIKKAKIDDLVEPIHDHIETEDNSRYNKRTAAYLIGILFWLRVRDFEEGAGEDGSRN